VETKPTTQAAIPADAVDVDGEGVNLYVSVNPAQAFTVDVYRIGWYGGLGGRLRLHAGPITGATQAGLPSRCDHRNDRM